MNYNDFLPLEKDGMVGTTYGKEKQLEIIGWSGKNNRAKYYVLKCSICSKDSELFGEGVFRSLKNNLTAGRIPCGCNAQMNWTEAQQKIRASRKAKVMGYNFVDWAEKYSGSRTKMIMLCCKHGLWNTTKLQAFMSLSHGCMACRGELSSMLFTKPIEEKAQTIILKGNFSKDTILNKVDGDNNFWSVYCPSCKVNYKRSEINLTYKGPSCLCSTKDIQTQVYSYINLVKDNGNPIAIKFGISCNPTNRVMQQNRYCNYDITSLFIFKYDNTYDCRWAETICKRELPTGLISSLEMPDGWTETTTISNLDFIIKTYEDCGGRKIA